MKRAIDAIGHVSGRQDEQKHGEKYAQSDIAQGHGSRVMS